MAKHAAVKPVYYEPRGSCNGPRTIPIAAAAPGDHVVPGVHRPMAAAASTISSKSSCRHSIRFATEPM